MKLHFIIFVTALVVAAFWQSAAPQSARAAGPDSPGRALILGPTVSGGLASPEGVKASALFPGNVDVVASFAGITATGGGPGGRGFSNYRAIILGDPFCGSAPPSATVVNASVWGPAANGNIVIVGTDPTVHLTAGASSNGGQLVNDRGIDFAVADPSRTGAYITLSCYYWNGGAPSALVTNEPTLSGLGAFDVQGVVGCFNQVRKVANHPALTGLGSPELSNWSCSVHEAFYAWPANFTPLAIAEGIGTFQPSDGGTKGQPHILARSPDLVPLTGNTVPTSGVISVSGSGPVIECKWELPDMDSSTAGIQYTKPAPATHQHDDDMTIAPGPPVPCHGPGDTPATKPTQANGIHHMIQVAPNFENLPEQRQIQNWMAVDDPGTVSDTFWIVWEPCTTLTNPLCGLAPAPGPNLVKKLQVHGTMLGAGTPQPCTSLAGTSTTDGSMIEAAVHTGQVTADSFTDLNKGMISLCNQNVKGLYHSEWSLSKDQSCGEYRIDATAVSIGGATTTLTNYIDILCTFQMKIDFGGDPSATPPCPGGITFPTLVPGGSSTVGGDLIFAPPCDTHPTVKNVGNSGMGLKLTYSDLVGKLFGKHIYTFDACFGRAPDATLKCFNPIINLPSMTTPTSPEIDTQVDFGTLPMQVLCANELGKLDPSVHPQPGLPADTYAGTATLIGYAVPGECFGNKHVGG